ncbi:MAG TPA: metallophosphoesterase [Xanthobacteraceae bacterium]|jgi:3',5'-cyclic AMP phosphodiesterase CpdA
MFILAHLSDPHLGPLPVPRLRELLGKRATGFFNWRRRRHLIHRGDVLARIVADLKAQTADHVAVTGDLVNISLAGEYAPARAWLAALGPPQDVTLVPGNHDVYVRGAAPYPCRYWSDYMRADDDDPSAGEAAFPFVRRRGPLALIGMSSAVPTAPFLATGRLGSAQIDRLAAALDRGAREGRFRVVLIHHPPLSKPARHFKRLVDGAELRAALALHGAELVLHGHDHEHSLIELAGPQRAIPVMGVPSASAAPPGEHDAAGYNLYRIDGGAGRWRCEAIARGLSPDGGAVVEIKRTMLVRE